MSALVATIRSLEATLTARMSSMLRTCKVVMMAPSTRSISCVRAVACRTWAFASNSIARSTVSDTSNSSVTSAATSLHSGAEPTHTSARSAMRTLTAVVSSTVEVTQPSANSVSRTIQ